MATQNKITEILAAIKAIYPYYAKNTDIALLVGTWKALLKDYPDNAVEVAFYKCLQTCKMPPTPADVIENLRALQEAAEPTAEEQWGIYIKAIYETETQLYYFRFTAIAPNGKTQGENAREKVNEIWRQLPEGIKRYLGSKNELIRMARNYTDDELKFEKTKFLKTLPQIKEREKYIECMQQSEHSKLLIEQ